MDEVILSVMVDEPADPMLPITEHYALTTGDKTIDPVTPEVCAKLWQGRFADEFGTQKYCITQPALELMLDKMSAHILATSK